MVMEAFSIIWAYREGFLKGLIVTLQLCAIIWSVGIVGGAALGWAGARYPACGKFIRGVAFFLSGLPIIVLLFWIHYPAQTLLQVVINPLYTAALCFVLVNLFSVSDMVRGAILDFPKEYVTAARVCGLSSRQTMLQIQLPIILRQILPGLLMLQVTMLHTTLFASLISVEEIFRVAQRINASIYRPVEIYTALGIFFLAISLPVNGFALWLKARFTRNISER
jgi:ABC-type amino acid transport system permease subunit